MQNQWALKAAPHAGVDFNLDTDFTETRMKPIARGAIDDAKKSSGLKQASPAAFLASSTFWFRLHPRTEVRPAGAKDAE